MNIAAASILAKTSRDDLMSFLSIKNSHYNWIKNNAEKIVKEVINEHVKKLFK